MSIRKIRVEVPRAFAPLLLPKRYKAAYGGRGGAKSHFFAERLLLRCLEQRTRAVCIREVQNSIKDSVRQLLVDKIEKLGLDDFFTVLDAEIRGENGSVIIFRGMQSYNAENIKSLEDYDIAWVEEAQSLSEKSLRLLRPTIRKEGSELWFSWNPRFESDAVDMFFRGPHAPTEATVVNVNWSDNPWFPDVLMREKDRDYAANPELSEHIWGGAYQTISEGSYYGKLLAEAEREGRIGSVPYDPVSLVSTAWDLGADDETAIWFMQWVGLQARVIDYYEANNQPMAHFASVLKSKPYAYGDHFLPHDAGHKRQGKTNNASLSRSLAELGFSNTVLPNDRVEAGIELVRELIPKCWFDRDKCAEGLKALRNYRREYDDDRLTFKPHPHHDWASHGADAFRYAATAIKPAYEKKPRPQPARGQHAWMGS